MNQTEGDLIALAKAGRFDLIVHGCNCFCTMGAGIAKGIKEHFPEAYQADLATPPGDRSKLGGISYARSGALIAVNAYTQYDWKGSGRKADYEAIRSAFLQIKQTFPGRRIGYPMIGAGLAGGDWKVIAPIIDEALAGEDHTLVIYRP